MPKLLRAPNMAQCIGCSCCMLACARYRYDSLSIARSAIQVRTAGGLRGAFIADYCLGCRDDPPCAAVCHPRALTPRPGGGVAFDREKCITCWKCVAACPVKGIHADEEIHQIIVCDHCGICVRFCPHECLELEEVSA
ncbi:MAG: 4Fe-4S dicluster domain-containing protein [bacterium]